MAVAAADAEASSGVQGKVKVGAWEGSAAVRGELSAARPSAPSKSARAARYFVSKLVASCSLLAR